MPSTKKFGMRQVGLTGENKEILKLWSDLQQKYMKDNPMFIFNLEKKDNPNAPVEITGRLGVSIQRTANSWTDINFGDNGLKIYLKEVVYTLDSDAKDLLNDFNIALVKIALEIGCSSNSDYDKVTNTVLLAEPFALIKEILVRTLAHALNVQGGVNANSSHAFQVFKEFIEQLPTLSIAEEKHVFSKPTATKLNTALSRTLPIWISAVEHMIKWVAELNKTDNIIQSNLEKLDTIQTTIYQHVYYNLMQATNRAKEVGRDILLIDWTTALLETLELEILASKPNTLESKQLATLATCSNSKSEKEIEQICSAIENKSNGKIIINLKTLYSALRAVNQAIDIVKATERITKDTGCMAFLLGIIEADALSSFIQKSVTLAINACKGAQFENSPLVETLSSLNNCKVSFISGCDFSELAFPEFIETGRNRIAHNFIILEKLCQAADCTGVLKWNPNLLMGEVKLTQSLAQPSKLQPEVQGNIDKKHTTFRTYFNHEPIEFELTPKLKTKNSFLEALGLDRNQVINDLLEQLETENDEIKLAVSYEASLYFQDKSLPQALALLLESHQAKAIEEPRIYLETLCKKLREELKKSSDNQQTLPINNNQLLGYLVQIHSPLLETYKKDIDNYSKLKLNKDNLLQVITMDLKFCLAYFNWYYIDQEGDFIYKPNGFFVLNQLVNLYKLPLSIWKQQASGTISLCESFNQEAEQDNPVLARHVLYLNDNNAIADSLFQSLKVKEATFKANKKPLIEILTRVMDEDESILHIEQKKLIFKHFCESDIQVAEANYSAKLENIEQIKLRLKKLEPQACLHNTFKTSGLQSVLEHLQTQTQKELNLNPNATIDEALKKKLGSEIHVAVQSYIYSGMKETFKVVQLLQNKEKYPLELKNKGITYRLMESTNPSKPFWLFTQESGLCFAMTQGQEYQTFKETPIHGDGDCGFNAMEIDRESFVNTLKAAMSNQANREILSVEILEYLKIMYSQNSQLWEHLLLTPSLRNNFEKEHQLAEKIRNLKLGLEEGLNKNLSEEEWLVLDDKDLDSKSKQELNQLKKASRELQECSKAILEHCMNKDICDLYIGKFRKARNLWLGKCGARVYVKEKNIALHVYDKSPLSKGAVSPILNYDNETSYNPKNPSRTCYIVFEKGIHYNKLELIDRKNLCPTTQWAQYVESFNQELSDIANAYQPELNSTLAQYVEKIARIAKAPSSLTLGLARDQVLLDTITLNLQEEEALLELKNKRCGKLESLGVEVSNYLDKAVERYPLAYFKDLLIHVDAPINKQNQTLLLKAVESKKIELVQCLLDIGASVAVKSDTDFEIKYNPKVTLEGLCNTYVLELVDNVRWSLSYFDHAGEKEALTINSIQGLKQALPKSSELSMQDRDKIEKCLCVHHSIYKKTTPLLKASQTIGFLEKDTNPIFYSLLHSAVKQAEPRLNELNSEEFSFLKDLSLSLTGELVKHFKTYIEIQKERGRDWRYNLFREFCAFCNVFGDQTQNRAQQLALLLTTLIDGEKDHEYLPLINNFKGIQLLTDNKKGILFGEFTSIVDKNDSDIQRNSITYNDAIEKYRTSRTVKSGSSQLGIDDEEKAKRIKTLEDELSATKSELSTTKSELSTTKSELSATKSELSAKIDATQDEHKKDIALLKEQIMSFTQSSSLLQTNSKSQSVNPSSFFQSNCQAKESKPQLRTQVTNLSEKHQKLFAEHGLEITQLSDTKLNFFTAMAAEINRIKKLEGEAEVTESGLRQFFYNYYRKTLNCKKKITGLNQAFKATNEGDFQEDRLDHYEWIKFDNEKKLDSGISIIDGVCAVEGVLLCTEYRLPCIFELKLDEKDQIHFGCVTDKGYINLDDEPLVFLEINNQVDNSPILFIVNGDYYFVSITEVFKPKLAVTDDENTEELSEELFFSQSFHKGRF